MGGSSQNMGSEFPESPIQSPFKVLLLPSYRTTDQLFTLRILIEQSKQKRSHFIVVLWTSKSHSIICRVKCCGMCWLSPQGERAFLAMLIGDVC